MQTLLWDPVNGIGLTLLRIGIDGTRGTPNIMGNAGYADGQACVKFNGSDCKVWAAPWSPPASMKDNNNVNNGGHLLAADYSRVGPGARGVSRVLQESRRCRPVRHLGPERARLHGELSVGIFNASQMVSLINTLGPMLAALSPPVKVLAAEPDNWGNIWGGDGYGPAIIADSMANTFVGPIATHDYGGTSAGTFARPAPPANNTHHVWETECTPGDTGPITIATMIYAAFSTGGVNGWHYWWTQALVPNASSPPPQVYALGNFSKFVRPGYYRVDVSGAPKPSASVPLVVAFTNLSDATVSIVVVNGGAAAERFILRLGHGVAGVRHPVCHDDELQVCRGDAHLASPARASRHLSPAQSVTTFVGKP